MKGNDEKRAVFIRILRFLYQSALISKENHCHLSLHDDFDYNSADFSQIIEKKNSSVGGVNVDHLDVISNILGALRTIQRTLNSIYTEILSSSR